MAGEAAVVGGLPGSPGEHQGELAGLPTVYLKAVLAAVPFGVIKAFYLKGSEVKEILL